MKTLISILSLALLTSAFGQKVSGYEKRFKPSLQPSVETEARLDQWFRDAKYGAFIHFGVYSSLAGKYKGKVAPGHYSEWIRQRMKISPEDYHAISAEFNPAEFDAQEWVQIFKDAGMKYVVITAKHHDGFALYDSAVSSYNIVDHTPFKRDIIKELSEACQAAGLKFGVYYSHAKDWDEPDAASANVKQIRTLHPDLPADFEPDLDRYFEKKSLPQIKELLTNYQIDLLWCDTPHGMTPERAKRVSDLVRSINPDCVINSRILYRAAQSVAQENLQYFDYGSLKDKEVPEKLSAPSSIYVESPDSVSSSYGYKAHGHHEYHSEKEMMERLIHTVCNNGNYLLNNGPMGNGKIDPEAVKIYQTIGAWLKVNGESIYGTRENPLPYQPKWGDISVSKDQKHLYLHILHWPEDGVLTLTELPQQVSSAQFLSNGATLDIQQENNTLTLKLPLKALNAYNTVIKLSFEKHR